MAPFWSWEIPLILTLQQGHPIWTLFFQIVTLLGDEEFALLVPPFLYWCLSKEVGVSLMLLYLSNHLINTGLKDLFRSPRPFQYDSRVLKLDDIDGYGLPSGHTQSTTVIWLYLASKLRRAWAWGLAVGLIVAVGLSRLYLGVHFPIDVAGGLLIGLVVLGAFVALEPTILHHLGAPNLGVKVGALLGIGIVLSLLHPTSEFVTAAALFSFGITGLLLEQSTTHFDVVGPWKTRLIRYVVGLIGLIVIWGGLRVLFKPLAPDGTALSLMLRWLRYGLTALWMTWGAPALFLRLHLAQQRPQTEAVQSGSGN